MRKLAKFLLLYIASVLLSAGFFVQPGAAQTFFDVLGVPRGADLDAIRKAHKKLSIKLSPEKNPGDEEAAKKLKDVNYAYETLKNPEKSQIYQQYGEDELEKYENSGNEHYQKSPTIKHTISVTLEELYKGLEQKYDIKRKVYCDSCRGTGAEGGQLKTCPKCRGHGVVTEMMNMGMMQMQVQNTCRKCGGRGKIFKNVCPVCGGRKVVDKTTNIKVKTEKGMENGEKIVFRGEGEQQPGAAQGDVVFKLRQKKHQTFRRVGNNLYLDIHLSLKEALLGFKRTITHLDGRTITIQPTEDELPIQPNSWKVIAGEGMPKRNTNTYLTQYGELHIKMIVDFPRSLTPKQKQILEQIFPLDDKDIPQKAEDIIQEDL